jgi:hypothetical protein
MSKSSASSLCFTTPAGKTNITIPCMALAAHNSPSFSARPDTSISTTPAWTSSSPPAKSTTEDRHKRIPPSPSASMPTALASPRTQPYSPLPPQSPSPPVKPGTNSPETVGLARRGRPTCPQRGGTPTKQQLTLPLGKTPSNHSSFFHRQTSPNIKIQLFQQSLLVLFPPTYQYSSKAAQPRHIHPLETRPPTPNNHYHQTRNACGLEAEPSSPITKILTTKEGQDRHEQSNRLLPCKHRQRIPLRARIDPK